MQNEQASRTALVIAASLVLLHRDPKHSVLVSKTSAYLCAQMLEMHSSQTRLFLKILRQRWFRPIAKLTERITIQEFYDLVRPWRIIRFFDLDDLRKMELGLTDESIARGEVICLAEI